MPDDEPVIVFETSRRKMGPSEAGSSQPQASGSGDKTDFSKFKFSPLRGRPQAQVSVVEVGRIPNMQFLLLNSCVFPICRKLQEYQDPMTSLLLPKLSRAPTSSQLCHS